MNKVAKTAWITIAINVAISILLLMPTFISKRFTSSDDVISDVRGIGVLLFLQFLVGIALAAGKKYGQTGKGILLAVGVVLLIGFAVCGTIALSS
jgi:ACR3 family arsenite efflux pump ArsB